MDLFRVPLSEALEYWWSMPWAGVLIVSLFHAFEALSFFLGMSDLFFSFQISREFGSINFHWYGLVLLLSSSELL
jgi:hypothetical protein